MKALLISLEEENWQLDLTAKCRFENSASQSEMAWESLCLPADVLTVTFECYSDRQAISIQGGLRDFAASCLHSIWPKEDVKLPELSETSYKAQGEKTTPS
jgi:hypothetical protein